MSIFSKMRDFLFGKQFITVGGNKGSEPAPQVRNNPGQPSPAAPVANPPTASIVLDRPAVDIAALLDREAADYGQPLNWRQSIVDLMKLTGIDPSLQNRRELAQELGYSGDMNETAAMNLWLHRQVMRRLEDNGGIVPAELRD